MVLQLLLGTVPVWAEGEGTDKYQAPESPAVTYNMNVDWSFRKASGTVYPLKDALESVKDTNGKNFYEKDYAEDENWKTVSVPHAVNAEDSFDGLGVDAGEGSLYRGFMFYRKSITIPADTQASKFFLEFEAFRQSVYLYVNGELVGYYEAGVAPVGFDITDYVTPGEEALIAVATDNSASRGNDNDTKETIAGSKIPDDANNGYGYQWNTKDFNEVQGGLTGNVNLYAKGSIYQTLPLYNNLKTTGNYIYGSNFHLQADPSQDIKANSADITVEAEVRNESDADKDITLEVNVVDKDGNCVATFEQTENVPAAADKGAKFVSMVPENAYDETGVGQENNNVDISTVDVTKITAEQNVADLHFWSDKSPYLYDVYTILKDGETVIDVQKKTTGFRDVQYDKDDGLQINGQTTYLKGYAQRSTNEWAAIGVANDWLTDIDMQLIKESNANMIRWMHIAPNPVDIRGGDKYGVISIVPAGDKEKEATGRQWDQRVEAMRDVIIYFRNSPSAIFYEAGNDYINPEHMGEMVKLKKALDPNGGRFMGSRAATTTPLSITDAADPDQNPEWVGTIIHRQDETMYNAMKSTENYVPMIETEYHRNESPRRVWDDYSGPYYDYVNKWLGNGGDKQDGFDIWDQTQEDMSLSMFGSGDCYSYFYNNRVKGTGKNMYSGAAMMVWSDSNMHVRNCAVENCRTSGRVDPIRIKKEAFYAVQAAQSETPKIHIVGHWNYPSYTKGDENGEYWYYKPVWNGHNFEITAEKEQRDPTNKKVYVIGSDGLSKVELYINDELVGTETTPTDNFIYAFDGIDVTQSGKVSAKAYTEMSPDTPVAEYEIKTAGEPARIKLIPVYGPDGLRADGSDLMYVDVQIVDEEDNVCPLDERKISFELSDTEKATFIGGYNSGYYGNYDNGTYNEPGGRIVNHKNYVFAECGINRVFVQSTRNAGTVTLTATAEGMQPAQIEIDSKAFELEGGLSTVEQQSFAQGEVPEPPKPETAPSLKSLGEVFTADWDETTGNVETVSEDEKDYYTVTVNGTEVSFTDKAYKPDTSTGVVGEVNPILDALKAAGADFTYKYVTEGALPTYQGFDGSLPYLQITSGGKTIDVANGSTTLFIDGEKNLTNFGIGVNSARNAMIAELSAVLGQIEGISTNSDEEGKVFAITYTAPQSEINSASEAQIKLFADDTAYPAAIAYSKGTVTVTAKEKIENAKLIIAGYNDKGALINIQTKDISLEAGASESAAINEELTEFNNAKTMLWDSFEGMKPLSLEAACVETYKPDEVYEYDEVKSNIDCNTAVDNMVLSTDTSPDGTAYLSNTSFGGSDKYQSNGVCLQSQGIGENSKADIMWEADVRFDEDGAGLTPFDDGDKKLGTCIRRHDSGDKKNLTIQTGSTNFTTYTEIDPAKWYHIALIGRYSASDAKTDMYVYEYNGSEKTLVGIYTDVNQRNMSANNSNGASHWNVHKGTSVDNLRITMLGADSLKVTSNADEIKAGNVMQMDYSATRQNEYIAKPAVKWGIYDEADETLLNSEETGISIDENGILNIGLSAESRIINVRATAEVKEGVTVYKSKKIEVKAVDILNVKFDTLTLTAEKDYVSVNEPLTINVAAEKGGAAVTLADSDLIWYATDSTDMMKLGEDLKWIKINNGVVTVDPKAVSQDITIRAADPEDKIRGSLKLHIKSSDALEGNEKGALDRLLTADNCEAPMKNANLVTSIDGTHAYQATAGYQTAQISETASDIVVEMDIRFDKEGAGFQPAKSGKLNTCVIYHNGKFAIQTGSSNFTSFEDIDPTKWYHITLIRKKDAYAHIILEEYDENGNRVNKKVHTDVNQRNNEATAFVNINAGTSYDNIRILTPAPTDIKVKTDVSTVFAGGTVSATSTLLWNDLEMKSPDASTLEYKIYDSEDKLPLGEDAKVTVDGAGLVKVDAMAPLGDYHVRAVAKASGKYDSAKFTVVSSDIIKIDGLGVNEAKDKMVNLKVTKNFYYANELTFVAKITDKNGNVVQTNSKTMLGSSFRTGENTVSLGFALPADFNETTDAIKIYALTKLNSDAATEADEAITLTAGGETNTVVMENVPKFDANSTVLVMALTANADETAVSDEDILFFDQLKAEDIENGKLVIASDYEPNMAVKISGNINGVHTVIKAVRTTPLSSVSPAPTASVMPITSEAPAETAEPTQQP